MTANAALTFAESAALLAIAAGLAATLTHGLTPIIVQRATRRRLEEQKRFEEDLRRETAFIAAQADLLKELSAALWDFQAKGLAVSYAGAYAPKRFLDEWQAYDRESFALLARINALMSVAGTLFSPATTEEVQSFYDDWLIEHFDRPLSRMARAKADQATWCDWHDPHHGDAETKTAGLLRLVADEAGLSYARRRSTARVDSVAGAEGSPDSFESQRSATPTSDQRFERAVVRATTVDDRQQRAEERDDA